MGARWQQTASVRNPCCFFWPLPFNFLPLPLFISIAITSCRCLFLALPLLLLVEQRMLDGGNKQEDPLPSQCQTVFQSTGKSMGNDFSRYSQWLPQAHVQYFQPQPINWDMTLITVPVPSVLRMVRILTTIRASKSTSSKVSKVIDRFDSRLITVTPRA